MTKKSPIDLSFEDLALLGAEAFGAAADQARALGWDVTYVDRGKMVQEALEKAEKISKRAERSDKDSLQSD